jgi:phage-related holin
MIDSTYVIATTKISWYIGAIAFFEYLNIIDTQFYILWILMIIDFIAWISKQYVLDKSGITSKQAWLWLIKKVLVLMVFLSIALMFKWLDLDSEAYLKAIASILIMAETYSIIQNAYTVRSWKELPEFDAVSLLLKKMGEIIESYLKNKIK